MSTPPQGEPSVATEQAAIPLPPPEALAIARQLAVTLGETEEKPIIQIARIVDTLGPEETKAFVEKAQVVYAGDGLLAKDKATGEMRKRTLGGTFFRLVRDHVGEKDWRKKIKPVMKQKALQAASPEAQYIIAREAANRQNFKPGNAASSKLILMGRPGTVQKQPTFVAVTVKVDQPPQFPKGLPTLKTEVRHLVLITTKHWAKVEETITKNKEDSLYIEGYPMIQPGFSGIVVQATNVNTLGLMRGKKQGGA